MRAEPRWISTNESGPRCLDIARVFAVLNTDPVYRVVQHGVVLGPVDDALVLLVFDDLNVAVADEDGRGVEGLQDVRPCRLVPEGDVLEALTTRECGLSPRYF